MIPPSALKPSRAMMCVHLGSISRSVPYLSTAIVSGFVFALWIAAGRFSGPWWQGSGGSYVTEFYKNPYVRIHPYPSSVVSEAAQASRAQASTTHGPVQWSPPIVHDECALALPLNPANPHENDPELNNKVFL